MLHYNTMIKITAGYLMNYTLIITFTPRNVRRSVIYVNSNSAFEIIKRCISNPVRQTHLSSALRWLT